MDYIHTTKIWIKYIPQKLAENKFDVILTVHCR